MLLPRTPSMNKQPRPDALRANRRKRDAAEPFYSKGMAHLGENQWIAPSTSPKSLIVYNCYTTGCVCFSTGYCENLHLFYIFLHMSVFCPFPPISIYLFIYKEEKKRKQPGNRKGESTGCKRCLFFKPLVFYCIHWLPVDICGKNVSGKQSLDAEAMGIHESTGFFATPSPETLELTLNLAQ